MLINNPKSIHRKAVGCILTYKGKYYLVHRTKDNLWNSITGNIEKSDNTPEEAIKRELQEEINLDIEPKKITTLYHEYNSKIVEYHLFYHNLSDKEYASRKLHPKEHDDEGLFTLAEALNLELYEDEDYCLKLHNKKVMRP